MRCSNYWYNLPLKSLGDIRALKMTELRGSDDPNLDENY
jgi:hypothetical protein